MSKREIIQTAMVLGGLWIVISGFSSLAPTLASSTMIISSIGEVDVVDDLILPGLIALAVFLMFSLVPGYLVIDQSEKWARRLFPDSDQTVELGPSLLFAAGAMLFGVVWMVEGAILLPISLLRLAFYFGSELSPSGLESVAVSMATALLWFLAGFLLFRYGARLARHAA
ncbi:MAG: hypothetical protein NXI30_03725 [bacterium]|nr:hypothetical protein [bacterium]